MILIEFQIWTWNLNRNFFKVGIGTAVNHLGSTTLLLFAMFLSFAASLIACHLSQFKPCISQRDGAPLGHGSEFSSLFP
jgi:hypothetical protein